MGVIEHKPPIPVEVGKDEKITFLAGPVQGAPDWQSRAINIISGILPVEVNLHVANPRRDIEGLPYETQVSWEKSNLIRCRDMGAIVFWLAAKDDSITYEEGRSYAQTTRLEFGRALGWRDYNPEVKVALGIEPGYKGNEKYYIHCAEEHELTVHDELEATLVDALTQIGSYI